MQRSKLPRDEDEMTSPDKLVLGEFIPYNLVVTATKISRRIGRVFEDRLALTLPQWRVIANLGSRGPMAQLQLVQQSAMDKIAVSRAAASLREKGLVTVEPGHSDKRYRLLELTAEGRSLYAEGAKLALLMERRLLTEADIGEPALLREQLLSLAQASEVLNQFE